eukprot:61125_1
MSNSSKKNTGIVQPSGTYSGTPRCFAMGTQWDVFFDGVGWQVAKVIKPIIFVDVLKIGFESVYIGKQFGTGLLRVVYPSLSTCIAEKGCKTYHVMPDSSYAKQLSCGDAEKVMLRYLEKDEPSNNIITELHKNSLIYTQKTHARLFWTAVTKCRIDIMTYLSRFWHNVNLANVVLFGALELDTNMFYCIPKYERKHFYVSKLFVLHAAVQDTKIELLRFFLSNDFRTSQSRLYGKIVARTSTFDESTISHRAAEVGNPEILQLLSSKGLLVNVNRNPMTNDGFTVLHVFVWSAGSEFTSTQKRCADIICRKLTQAQFNVRTKARDTAMSLCVKQENLGILRYLLTKGAKLDFTSRSPHNILNLAIREGSPRIVQEVVRLISVFKSQKVCVDEQSVAHRSCTEDSCLGRRFDEEGVSLWDRVRLRPEIRVTILNGSRSN